MKCQILFSVKKKNIISLSSAGPVHIVVKIKNWLHLVHLPTMISKGDNFHDFRFAFLYCILVERGSTPKGDNLFPSGTFFNRKLQNNLYSYP